MIKIEDIYARTNGGLDIILSYYPQAKEDAVMRGKKPFKRRNEKTPSAFLRQKGNIWKVTDFGDDGQEKSAIDIVMDAEHLSFKDAVALIGCRFGVNSTLSFSLNRPKITKRDATENEKEGDFVANKRDKFTEFELDVWGANVQQKHLDDLSYFPLISYAKTKKDENGKLITTIVESNENYPIFMRDCGEFKKIYQPLNPDKSYRFFYVGSKPKDFLNGLQELKKAYEQYQDPIDEDDESGRPNKVKKLPEAVICCGERDAVNCKSFGYCPLWLNSETAQFTKKMYSEVMRYVEKLYNIPDRDETGVRKGRELAFQYIDIYTCTLPDWLKNYNDNRGKPRKDLRDYVELRSSREDFENLLKTAMPIRFWEEQTIIDPQGNIKKRLDINSSYFLNFLAQSGFCRINDNLTKEEFLVQVDNSIVRTITPKNIRAYVLKWLDDRYEDLNVKNLLLNSNRTKAASMDDLPLREISFSHCESDRQFFFFKNLSLEVMPQQVIEHTINDCGRYVWEKDIADITFKRIAPSFMYNFDQIDGTFTLFPTGSNYSHYFRYLINASRIYWREELEQRISMNQAENEAYNATNKWCICGPRLTQEEQAEQMQNLAAKIFAIGYLLHRYKNGEKAWALWCTEDKISEDGESSGGSGKSFMIKFLKKFRNILFLGGRDNKLTENQFLFQNVTESTDVIWIDDANQYFDSDFFFDKITGEMVVNKKHVDSASIEFEKSPKIVFTSNFPPPKKDSATLRRLLFVVFSDYYHQKTDDNDYRETRRIYDDFDMELAGSGYTNEMYNEDINFLIDCVQFYLNVSAFNIKVEPPMNRIKDRMSVQIMGNQFREWAEVYFNAQSENVDCLISKENAFNDFLQASNVKGWTTAKFSKAIKEFCQQCEWITELNPRELINDQRGRIIRKVRDQFKQKDVSKEMYYIRVQNRQINATIKPLYS